MLAFPRPARRGPLIFLISLLLIVCVVTYRSRFLIGLLFENGYPDVIDPVHLLDTPGAIEHSEKQTPLIPKIIHQTYKNTSVPEAWGVSQKACKKLHPEFEYMVRAPFQNTNLASTPL
jgi:inositol phosphorylceramide mannosyltransferase catalytic subunit